MLSLNEIGALYRFVFAEPRTPGEWTEFRLTLGDLRHDFQDGQNCPLYCALKRSGAPVEAVAGNFWVDRAGLIHFFEPAMYLASVRLSRSNNHRWTRLFTLWRNKYRWSAKDGRRLRREDDGVIVFRR